MARLGTTDAPARVRLDADDLVQALGPWSSSPGSLHQRLADGIRAAIQRGSLPVGSRMPSERELAATLAISRSTVTAAYESLEESALLESRRGSGSYVAVRPAGRWLERRGFVVASRAATGGLLEPSAEEPINFMSAAPPDGSFVTDEAIEEGSRAARSVQPGDGYLALGLPALRDAIALHLSASGMPTTREQILVTTGAQEAVYLTARMLVEPGEAVLIEDPTWLGAIDALRTSGARLHAVPIDEHGLRTDLLRSLITRGPMRALYVSPSVNNPTGALLSEARRVELVRLAEENAVTLVEDNCLADLVPRTILPAPLGARARDVPVLTIGSLSKLIWGGLRIGWVRAAPALITRLAHWKLIFNSGSAIVSQGIALHLMRDLDQIRAKRHDMLWSSLDALAQALTSDIPDWEWRRPPGGLTVWVTLPFGTATEFGQVALRHGVAVAPGSLCSPRGAFLNCFRLPFVLPPETIREGVRRLGAAWAAYGGSAARREPRIVV